MSSRSQILMCHPAHFDVQYVINPWMEGHVGRVRKDVALEQWDHLFSVVSQLVRVAVIEGSEDLPDMCFTANAGFILGNRFVPSTFRFYQRQPEIPLFSSWFDDAGFDVDDAMADTPFEGEGDALLQLDGNPTPVLWAGYSVRSSLESHREINQRLQIDVVSLRLVDERFYHLDTCFVPLGDGRVMYYPAAFDEMSLKQIRQRVPGDQRLEVGESDAMRFACNALLLDHTLITNHASDRLIRQLSDWGYETIVTPVDEFILAGGAVKCLCLIIDQHANPVGTGHVESPIRSTHVELHGHLLDSGLINRIFDSTNDAGGEAKVEQLTIAQRHDQPSTAQLRIIAPSADRLDMIINRLMLLGARPSDEPQDARLEPVTKDGVAPNEFYSTTIYPTEVRCEGNWIPVDRQRMDAVIVVEMGHRDQSMARCRLIRDLRIGQRIVCGVDGVRVNRPMAKLGDKEFSFMSAGVSTERRVELAVQELAWEMRRIKNRGGRIVCVAGPVVVHTGGAAYLSQIIRLGYVQALLTGNALPVHDIEYNLFGTSLGVDLRRGVGVHGGHQHHIRAINLVRGAGSIREAVEQGLITGGIMYECVRNGVDYVLAGSIRDDGPLPDTFMDLTQAQAAYAAAIEKTDMILMLASMLHAIGTGNMTPAGVRLVCVDITPSVVTKLADRGSIESTGIVTDVGLFLNLLARRLSQSDA
ncbi:MAG: TIGR00300 family protein [Pirellulales bacterium]|nr:TIGR00300 family protein [Pirellulales bacterium]